MKTNLKNFPNLENVPLRCPSPADKLILSALLWKQDFEAELRERLNKEGNLLVKGYLSETSQEVARVLILRYREILGE